MSVELKSCSPEITIEGLPCEVEEYDIQTIYVTFDTFYGMMTGDYSVGLKTDFIRMGDNPTFEFSYALQESNTLHEDTGAAVSAEIPQIEVYISDDYEVTWTNVYTIGPDADNTFDGELGFHKVRIELPEFAGKTCRARIAFRHASGNVIPTVFLTRRRFYMKSTELTTLTMAGILMSSQLLLQQTDLWLQ